MHTIKIKKKPRMIVKVDLSKVGYVTSWVPPTNCELDLLCPL